MAWSDITQNGGKPNFRLSVEGWPDEWVTHSDIAGTATDGRERRVGLSYEGLEIREEADLRSGLTKSSSMTVTIRSPDAVLAFAKVPKIVSALVADFTTAQAICSTQGHTEISVNDYVHMNSEAVKVSSKGTSPNTLTVARGQWDTITQNHWAESKGLNRQVTAIYDGPLSMHGRRARLYAYSEDETGASVDGTQIWLGVVDGGPQLDPGDGLTWNINIRPITDLLKHEVAHISDIALPVRGYHYSEWHPLTIFLQEYSSSSALLSETAVHATGFFETQAHLVAEINTQLATISGLVLDAIDCTGLADGRLQFRVRLDAATVTYPVLVVYSPMDGGTIAGLAGGGWTRSDNTLVINYQYATGTDYFMTTLRQNLQPTGCWGVAIHPTTVENDNLHHEMIKRLHRLNALILDDSANSTHERIYASGLVLSQLAAGESVVMTNVDWWIADGPVSNSASRGKGSFRAKVETINTTDGFFTVAFVPHPGVSASGHRGSIRSMRFTAETRIQFSANTQGNLHDFLSDVVDTAPDVNIGNTPAITANDIDVGASSEWEDVVDLLAEGEPYLDSRSYVFSKGIALEKVLGDELKMLGAQMRLQSDGKIGVVELRHAVAADTAALDLSDDTILTPPFGSWPAFRLNRDGLVNVVEFVETVNQADEDKEPDVIVKDTVSLAAHRNRGAAVDRIEPKSSPLTPISGKTELDEIVLRIARRIFSFFANDYHIVEVDVSWPEYASALVGALGTLTSPHIPNSLGTMGVTSLPVLVVGRRWVLDPAHQGPHGRLTLATQDDVGGYAPAARIASATDSGGNTWVCTVTGTKYAPTGKTDASYFKTGFEVEVIQYDTRPVNSQTGSVSAVSGNDITIDFDGTAPWGGTHSGVYDIRFVAGTSDAVVVGDQANYVYLADDAGEVATTKLKPRVFV